MFDEATLCIPALRFKTALADVVVADSARKSEVVGEHAIERAQVHN